MSKPRVRSAVSTAASSLSEGAPTSSNSKNLDGVGTTVFGDAKVLGLEDEALLSGGRRETDRGRPLGNLQQRKKQLLRRMREESGEVVR
mmetsp:Transcript_21352/g.48502  ORF Transcript_21352/g.48502 Transcript_21352/m.48502 type:complete len:89 (-) Transcript_21352:147-413(-)